ncbi:hypothetical protein VOLCADRAFT_104364 [Volvox carteri f. nagariensis]|uniref:N-acetyltransferase domain-containing protein n=1 Tax=Volvox carteri f. nagariensis TaxID=3068 RepID=D8TT91_VOLCA|nr:uncharacterized protein VOLCADRAFT_104364 [Volvox carteri f. nagariensis]EFJ49157.1 hypothetical protein VOLCADRAFT_104364 [Volvox carteri f. nagariensis]|eukprot:XP_002949605.1 hypothetical protein VOLCADRAFT_104364 [Volvox carteri f. nagariensis]
MATSEEESNHILEQYQSLGNTIFFAPVQPEHLIRIHELESSSYPADEAATFQKLEFRILSAPNVFMVAMQCRDGGAEPEVVGYVCGTCTNAGRLTHESMATHDQEGALLCIHSVVVEAGLRRKGLATRLLRAYVPYVQATTPHLQAIRLICKQDLIGLYEKAGFTLAGPSDVVHGRDPWFEMVLELPSGDS